MWYDLFNLTRLDILPVWISTQSTLNSFDFLTSLIEGFINKLVRILFFLNFSIIFFNFFLYLIKFNPPSVVTSFRFSGTRQIKSGLILSALLTILSLMEISRLTKIFFDLQIFFASKSLICLLSSLKWMVTEWAPNSNTFLATK